MIKQINLITLFLCAGQKGPFSLINPSAPLYYLHIYYLHIYYLLCIYCIYSQLDCVGLRPLPGVHTLLPEHLAVSVASQVLQGNPSCHHHHHHCDHHHPILSPTYHGAAAVCRCDTQLLEFIAAAEIQSWSGVMITQHTSSASSWAYLCQCWKIQKKRCQDDCHFELQILSSKIRISLQFPIRVK